MNQWEKIKSLEVISFEIRKYKSYNCFLQGCFGYSWSLAIPCEFQDELSISAKKAIGILAGIALNL